jgi:hypothetical protein
MKYIIAESRLENIVIEYLNGMFDVNNINSMNPYEYDNETGEEYDDDTRVEFYLGDHENGMIVDIFKWYDCMYFYHDSSAQDICPTVVIEHPYDDKLIAYFGDKWEEPFKKWFTENFDLPVKTVEWKRMID